MTGGVEPVSGSAQEDTSVSSIDLPNLYLPNLTSGSIWLPNGKPSVASTSPLSIFTSSSAYTLG